MTARDIDPRGGIPRSFHRASNRERRRIEKASVVLRCLVVVLQHAPEKPIESKGSRCGLFA